MNALLRDLLRGILDADALIDALVSGTLSEGAAAGLLVALAARGVDGRELAALARALRRHMVAVPVGPGVLDTCGTGGSGLETANTSTLAAFVVAGCGVRVAKHGNRASSGRCGSSDLLDALGLPLAIRPEAVPSVLDRVGLVFLFAPAFHPAVRHVAAARRALGIPTVFNLLGPLCNPAGPDHQVLGVSDPALGPVMIEALGELGVKRAMVVHGEDGLDEISLAAPTRTWTLAGEGRLQPADFGFEPCDPEDIRGGDVATNLAIAQHVLDGRDGPHTRLVLCNAAAALVLSGRAADLLEGVELARQCLASGAARAVLERLRREVDHARAA